jgi:hypothetical protein
VYDRLAEAERMTSVYAKMEYGVKRVRCHPRTGQRVYLMIRLQLLWLGS